MRLMGSPEFWTTRAIEHPNAQLKEAHKDREVWAIKLYPGDPVHETDVYYTIEKESGGTHPSYIEQFWITPNKNGINPASEDHLLRAAISETLQGAVVLPKNFSGIPYPVERTHGQAGETLLHIKVRAMRNHDRVDRAELPS